MQHSIQKFQPAYQYVTGFAFNPSRDKVLLIKKTKPAWQAGLLNGVGGKIEKTDQNTSAAMCREFLEETGISTTIEQWSFFGSHQKSAQHHLDEQAYSMYLFSTILTPDQMAQLSQPTEEEPKWLTLNDLASLLYNGVGGVLMYVTMAYNHYGKSFNTMTIETPT